MLSEMLRKKLRTRLSLLLLGVAGVSSLSGCSRQFWRKQADRDAYTAIGEKINDPHWSLPRVDLTPDPRSRFYDPWDPDKRPLPPDDPTAHELMHSVNGRRGYKNWHKLGVSFAIENPHWLKPYGIDQTGVDPVGSHSGVKLQDVSIPDAMNLTAIHSREYQNSIENLYLDALNLTSERFKLGVRYLGTNRAEPSADFTARSNAAGRTSGVLATPFGISQTLPTGGQIAADIANSVTWVFSGNGSESSAPSIGYSLTQPLLFNAGRKIALESLTQNERNVLYSVRTLARFRQTLFTQVASNYLTLLQQRQNILNTENNIRQLEEQLEAQEIRDTRVPGVVNAALDEFQNLQIPVDLQGQLSYDGTWLKWRGDLTPEQEQRILSLSQDPDYVAAASEMIDFKKQQTTSLSYLQLRDRLNRSQINLANSQRQLQDSQDSFKLVLGLPPNVDLNIDTKMLGPFELISWDLINLERDLRQVQKDIGNQLLPSQGAADVQAGPALAAVREYVTKLSQSRDRLYEVGIKRVAADFQPLEQLLERTKDDFRSIEPGLRYFRQPEERTDMIVRLEKDRRLYRLAEREFAFGSGLLDMLTKLLTPGTEAELMQSLDTNANGQIELAELPEAWKDLPRSGDRDAALIYTVPELLTEVASGARDLRDKYLLRMAQSLEVLQASLRVEQVAITPFSLDESWNIPDIEQVVALGLEYRHDLMNQRAAVMDARRQVEIQANRLEAGLDVTFRGTEGLNPDARNSTNHSAGLKFTTPLDQVLERNGYRQSLVAFQRSRRTYMEQEDRVKQSIRSSWRQLGVQEYRLKVDRMTVRNAALQYDSASLQAQGGGGGGVGGVGGGGQGNALSLINALDSVLQAQNGLVQDWVVYETNRLNIFRDMGIMEIDARGVWTDRFYLQMQTSVPVEGVSPPAAASEAPSVVPAVPATQDVVPGVSE
jgi:outer membrane protein TolC